MLCSVLNLGSHAFNEPVAQLREVGTKFFLTSYKVISPGSLPSARRVPHSRACLMPKINLFTKALYWLVLKLAKNNKHKPIISVGIIHAHDTPAGYTLPRNAHL